MNILIAACSYYPSIDGVSIVTQYQAEGLAKLGHKITVVTGEKSASKKEEIHNGIRIFRVGAYDEWMVHFGNKIQYRKMILELSFQTDILMSIGLERWNTCWFLPIMDNIHCKKFLMIHGIHDRTWKQFHDFSIYGLSRKIWGDVRWRLFYPLNWRNIRKYDAIAQLHEEVYANRFFRNHGITDCHILYNAVDGRFFQDISEKKNRIINVGTYCERKNQIRCMEIFYESEAKDWELVLIGSPKNKYYEKVLKKKQELDQKYGARNVKILYGQSRENTIEYIKQSKIYLLTSITEMFPVSLIEGMAAGCAFVSTDVGIDRYLPGGIVGQNRKELCAALNKLLDNETRNEYAEKGRNFAVQNCRQEEQVRKLEKILYDCVGQKEK